MVWSSYMYSAIWSSVSDRQKLLVLKLYLLGYVSSFFIAVLVSDFRKLAVLEVAREDEFSPLKNAKGTPKDNPDTSRRDLFNLHYKYIVEAGGKFTDRNGWVLLSFIVCFLQFCWHGSSLMVLSLLLHSLLILFYSLNFN